MPTWTTPSTQATNHVVTAGEWNEVVNDLINLNDRVTPGESYVATSQGTTSTSYTDLTTTGPSAVVTIGSSGRLLVIVGSYAFSSGNFQCWTSFALSGANTVAAADDKAGVTNGTSGLSAERTVLLTGLTPGSTTVTAKYKASGGTANFAYRRLIVMPL